MKLTLDCPKARYGPDMAIICTRDGEPCAHQYFKSCKGWWALTATAAKCPMRGIKGETPLHHGSGLQTAGGQDDRRPPSP